jgi:hypothetical protein
MIRYVPVPFLVTGIALGYFFHEPAKANGALLLMFACLILLILWIVFLAPGRSDMLNANTLNPGNPVELNVTVGPKTKTRPAIYTGSFAGSFTVQTDDPLHPVRAYRWNDPAVWISDPGSGKAYGVFEDDPILDTAVAERE